MSATTQRISARKAILPEPIPLIRKCHSRYNFFAPMPRLLGTNRHLVFEYNGVISKEIVWCVTRLPATPALKS